MFKLIICIAALIALQPSLGLPVGESDSVSSNGIASVSSTEDYAGENYVPAAIISTDYRRSRIWSDNSLVAYESLEQIFGGTSAQIEYKGYPLRINKGDIYYKGRKVGHCNVQNGAITVVRHNDQLLINGEKIKF